MTDDLPIQLHRRDCPLALADEVMGCDCPVYTDEQPLFDADVVALGGGGDDPLRWYLAHATRVRPVRWYEDQAQAAVGFGLPKWVDKPAWLDDPDQGGYVVFRRMKVARETCPRTGGALDTSGHHYCEARHTWQEHYGLIPLKVLPTQTEAVQWARADLEEQTA